MYYFDRVLGQECSQQDIYVHTAKPIIERVMQGFNGTVFAYGQTAAGKTYTMQGPNKNKDLSLQGIIPRTIGTAFRIMQNESLETVYEVKISMVEVHKEMVKDLLDTSKTNLKVSAK
jgi:hypothetical protein